MKRRPIAAALLVLLALALPAASASGRAAPPPAGFFGIDPQTALSEEDVRYMRAGGIETIRAPFPWGVIQPRARGAYDWTSTDAIVEMATRGGLRVMPFLYGAPHWLSPKPTTLPIDSGRARRAWTAFVKATVERYGPGGEFWSERTPAGGVGPEYATEPESPLPISPIRTWQVWNEANFFYFAYPVSPGRYARLLKLTAPAIKAVDPGAEVVLSGLFGNPDESGRRGMDATKFLDALYRSPGIRSRFDAVALHPYAFHVEDLEALTEETRSVMLEHHDGGAGLYITEMGWGSQNDPNMVAFEQGLRGQARELHGAYRYLIRNRRRLNLKGVYWYSWKDSRTYTECHFCDSVGLFRAGAKFRAKPAWHAFVGLTGGRARP
jgi:Beta-galactosidase